MHENDSMIISLVVLPASNGFVQKRYKKIIACCRRFLRWENHWIWNCVILNGKYDEARDTPTPPNMGHANLFPVHFHNNEKLNIIYDDSSIRMCSTKICRWTLCLYLSSTTLVLPIYRLNVFILYLKLSGDNISWLFSYRVWDIFHFTALQYRIYSPHK